MVNVVDISNRSKTAKKARPLGPVQGIIFHHTAGTTVEGAMEALNSRRLSANYIIDADGTIYQSYPAGMAARHMREPGDKYRTDASALTGQYGNANFLGIEVVGLDDTHITPAQVDAAQQLGMALSTQYGFPAQNIWGHGELQSNKQSAEGMTIVNAIRAVNTGVPIAVATDQANSAAQPYAGNPFGATGQAAVSDETRRLQEFLQQAGYDPGPIDGVWGDQTQAAIDRYKTAMVGTPGQDTGTISPATEKLAGVILAEARGEGRDGMIGVGNVVMNRVADTTGRFPDTIDATINNEFAKPLSQKDVKPEEWQQAVEVAMGLQAGTIGDKTGGAIYFANEATASPGGLAKIKASGNRTTKIGNHTYFGQLKGEVPQAIAGDIQDPGLIQPASLAFAPIPEEETVTPPTPKARPYRPMVAGRQEVPGALPKAPYKPLVVGREEMPGALPKAPYEPLVAGREEVPGALPKAPYEPLVAGREEFPGALPAAEPEPSATTLIAGRPDVPVGSLAGPERQKLTATATTGVGQGASATGGPITIAPTPPERPDFISGREGTDRLIAGSEGIPFAPLDLEEMTQEVQPPPPSISASVQPAPVAPVQSSSALPPGYVVEDPGDRLAQPSEDDGTFSYFNPFTGMDPIAGQATPGGIPFADPGNIDESPITVSAPAQVAPPAVVSQPPPPPVSVAPPPVAQRGGNPMKPGNPQSPLRSLVSAIMGGGGIGSGAGYTPGGGGARVSPGGYTYTTGTGPQGQFAGQYTTPGGKTITYAESGFNQPGYMHSYG